MGKMRIGAVSYLNTKPLVHGLSDDPHVELILDLPSRLADRLALGELDVALIPSIEVVGTGMHPETKDAAAVDGEGMNCNGGPSGNGPAPPNSRYGTGQSYVVVSDACIACHAAVWSVKLLSRVPLERVRSVSLDEGSRTSVALTKILMRGRGVEPDYGTLPVTADWLRAEVDALLLIGDRAMHVDRLLAEVEVPFVEAIDLGEWWRDWTGLPFVFAVWAARSDFPASMLSDLRQLLTASRDAGLRHLEQIAHEQAAPHGLAPQQCLDYLQRHLYFKLGEQEKAGLARFYELAADLSLIAPDSQIEFYEHPTVEHQPVRQSG